jgi:hypothetical protein
MVRTILAIIGIILAAAILYYIFFFNGGVFTVDRASTTPLNIDLQDIKPSTWEPVLKEGLLEISIDKDDDPEWLFLYRDKGSTQQIGGVIYDAQNQPAPESGIEPSQLVSAYLVPYSLMPDYVRGKSEGYLADTTVYKKVVRVSPEEKKEDEEQKDKVLRGDRLQISGNFNNLPNRFSVFWWKDPQYGYGGTLAYTPGWFSLSETNPKDWPEWAGGENKDVTLVETLYAWEPQMDRSNICRQVNWTLKGDQTSGGLQFVSDYPHSKLAFCAGGTPSEPAFPEAQVLAFLLDGQTSRWQQNSGLVSYENVSVMQISEPEINRDSNIVDVFVDFTASDGEHRTVWQVQMTAPTSLKQSVHWRIVSVQER